MTDRKWVADKILNLPTNVNNIGWVKVTDVIHVFDEFIALQKVSVPSYVGLFIQEMKERKKTLDEVFYLINLSNKSTPSSHLYRVRIWIRKNQFENKELFTKAWVNGINEPPKSYVKVTFEQKDGTTIEKEILSSMANDILNQIKSKEGEFICKKNI